MRLSPILLVGLASVGAAAGRVQDRGGSREGSRTATRLGKLRLGGSGGGKRGGKTNDAPACKGLGEAVDDPCESDLCQEKAVECEKSL